MPTSLQTTVTTNHLQQFKQKLRVCRFDTAALIQMICTYEQLNCDFKIQSTGVLTPAGLNSITYAVRAFDKTNSLNNLTKV